MDMGYYILDGDNNLVHMDDVIDWSYAMQRMRAAGTNIVKQENVGQFWISTVFLGLDHNFNRMWGEGVPLVFETMVFEREDDEPTYVSNIFEKLRFSGGIDWHDIEMSRCSTWEQAEAQHAAVVRHITEMNEQLDRIIEGAVDAERPADNGGS